MIISKRDCFGRSYMSCSVLNEEMQEHADGVDVCEDCPFYKSKQVKEAYDKLTLRRIRTLGDWDRQKISDKYYYGLKPWEEKKK